MQIVTKFNVGDKVFVIDDNVVKQGKIVAISINDYVDNINYPIESYIKYTVKDTLGILNGGQKYVECLVFPTKEDLLKSL